MRLVRHAIAALVALAGASIAYGLVAQPLHCNVQLKILQDRITKMFSTADQWMVAREAQDSLARIAPCLTMCTDTDVYMTTAAADRLIGRLDHARAMYLEALRYDRRPEIYYNLGIVELRMDRRDEAIASFIEACRFNFALVNRIPDPEIAAAVVASVQSFRQNEMRRLGTAPPLQ